MQVGRKKIPVDVGEKILARRVWEREPRRNGRNASGTRQRRIKTPAAKSVPFVRSVVSRPGEILRHFAAVLRAAILDNGLLTKRPSVRTNYRAAPGQPLDDASPVISRFAGSAAYPRSFRSYIKPRFGIGGGRALRSSVRSTCSADVLIFPVGREAPRRTAGTA